MTPVIYGLPSRFLLVVCVLFSALVGVPAQQPTPKATPTPAAGQDPEKIETFIRRVRLPISVTDKKGVFISGLSQRDFLVLEDKLPQQIETFSDDLGEGSQLYLAVLMDTSPSTAGKLRFEQESAMNFIQTVVRPRKDRVLFATFDHEIALKQDFTDKLDLLDKAVFGVKKLGTQTAFYDAVWQFCDEKLRSVSGRRVLVVITDGEDTYSRADLRDAIDIAQRTETTIFAISTKAGLAGAVPGVQMGQVNSKSDHNLVKLAEETGGRAFFTGDMLELEKAFNRIKKELRAQYLVTYKPSNGRYDGSFRKIEVKLAS
ncbi:MAG: VWA domain-containing protein, partial [Pyrinomonadaceae bacterium]|nr:VWA domain-containing protein [Pyrinomonadaceae bacterium]